MKFNEFGLNEVLVRGIHALGFETPRPIQAETIPAGLDGRDVLGLAQTGTGKTAAFALPLLHRLLDGPRKNTRALIIAPTRELAAQITHSFAASTREAGRSCVRSEYAAAVHDASLAQAGARQRGHLQLR